MPRAGQVGHKTGKRCTPALSPGTLGSVSHTITASTLRFLRDRHWSDFYAIYGRRTRYYGAILLASVSFLFVFVSSSLSLYMHRLKQMVKRTKADTKEINIPNKLRIVDQTIRQQIPPGGAPSYVEPCQAKRTAHSFARNMVNRRPYPKLQMLLHRLLEILLSPFLPNFQSFSRYRG